MLDFLKVPKCVNENTTPEELVNIFLGYGYVFFVQDEDVSEQIEEILDIVQEIPYSPQLWWNALWLSGMFVMIKKDACYGLRNQIIQEVQNLEDMTELEIDSIFKLYFATVDELFSGSPMHISPRIVHQLNEAYPYYYLKDTDKEKIYRFANKHKQNIIPLCSVLKDNAHFNHFIFIRDLVDSVVSSPNYMCGDYKDYISASFRHRCGWEEDLTESQIHLVNELNGIIRDIAINRFNREQRKTAQKRS